MVEGFLTLIVTFIVTLIFYCHLVVSKMFVHFADQILEFYWPEAIYGTSFTNDDVSKKLLTSANKFWRQYKAIEWGYLLAKW